MKTNNKDSKMINSVEYMIASNEKKRLNIIKKHIENGVIFKSFYGVEIEEEVVIQEGTVIYSDNKIYGNTFIAKNCILKSGNIIENSKIDEEVKIIKSVLKDCSIGYKTTVGPFAHIHTKTIISNTCRVGNFVEIKNSNISSSTKMAHLAYIGDCDIGSNCNIGCGAIFVNYDGKNKNRSEIGDSVFIGSNSNIIAPINIGDNAYIAAGSTITKDLPKKSLCIARSRETIKENRSKYFKKIQKKNYFGTDGIRGIYGEKLTDEIAYLTGNFLGYSSNLGKIVIGRDNRVSGEALFKSLEKGIVDAGGVVIDLGIVSTPCTAFVTKQIEANYGIVISASHNPWNYNGIKIFNYDARKLSDVEEIGIERHIERKNPFVLEKKGQTYDGQTYIDQYFNNLKNIIGDLSGFKILLDCANGAISTYAERIFKDLNANVMAYNKSSDGKMINNECGALYPHKLAEKVLNEKADVGFCFDGDADRIIAINEKGEIVNGDSIIYVLAKYLKSKNQLNKNKVVGTEHTNMGVVNSLTEEGIALIRAQIGDRYVVREMIKENISLGGEQSGHIILSEISNTGDGLLVALYLSKIMKETKSKLSELDLSVNYPQINKNIVVKDRDKIMENNELISFSDKISKELKNKGRILVRASGTEPLVRIMVESIDKDLAQNIANQFTQLVEKIEKNCEN